MTENDYKLWRVVRPSWPQSFNLKARKFEARQPRIWSDNVLKLMTLIQYEPKRAEGSHDRKVLQNKACSAAILAAVSRT